MEFRAAGFREEIQAGSNSHTKEPRVKTSAADRSDAVPLLHRYRIQIRTVPVVVVEKNPIPFLRMSHSLHCLLDNVKHQSFYILLCFFPIVFPCKHPINVCFSKSKNVRLKKATQGLETCF